MLVERGPKDMSDFDPTDNDGGEDRHWGADEEGEEGSTPDWYEQLEDDGPRLDTANFFYCSPNNQPIRVVRKHFFDQLLWCLGRLGVRQPVPQGLIDKLYECACKDVQSMDAVCEYSRRLQSDEFAQTLSFMVQETKKVEMMRSHILAPREAQIPPHLSEWTAAWVDSLGGHLEEILGQLKGQTRILRQHAEWLKAGRTEVESHLLRLTYSEIKEAVAGTPFARCPIKLLSAYAHASGLVRYIEEGDFGDAIKMRVARARKSRHAASVLGRLVGQSLFGK